MACKLCKYILNILIAIDESVNTITGGDPQETISSRAGKLQTRVWWAKYLCKFLNLLDKNHCQNSEEPTVGSNRTTE
jgi:hypothetical protein